MRLGRNHPHYGYEEGEPRGDSEAHYRRMEDAEPWVRVNLLVPLPIGGSHRAS